MIEKLLCKKCLEPYIKYIRFPHFRNLEADTRIDFDFPLTVLVGQNGTNKSSVLRALYGCPGQNSIGRFWFSTQVDSIDESGQRPSMIYGYYHSEASSVVEVLKTRITKRFKTKHNGKTRTRIDPDYWEPSRPLVSLGMKVMPDLGSGQMNGRSKTRWNAIKKEVVFIDFRSEISAFDKYFYHGILKKTLTKENKQDVIRSGSKHLKKIIDATLSSLKLYNKNVVKKNVKLTTEMVADVSRILGRVYSDIKLIQHTLFKSEGYSAVLQHGGVGYSEAWAGSGEFAVVKLVHSVSSANPNSLIILDEPEVSLHPGAQIRLTEFLLKRIKLDKHQIVLGTHSPFILKCLPPKAIKTLSLSPATGKVQVQQSTLPDQAFFHLEIPQENKIQIFTEDLLATSLVKKCLRPMGQALAERFEVINPPGGATSILHHDIPAITRSKRMDVLVILDGDQKIDEVIPDRTELQVLEIGAIKEWVVKLAHGEPRFLTDGGVTGGNVVQLKEAYLDYLDFGRSYMTYLPNATPEDFLWSTGNLGAENADIASSSNTKQRFIALTKKDLGREDYEDVSARDILDTQERILAKISNSNQELSSITDFLTNFISSN